VIGQFVAKAMLDSRIIDVSLNKLFLRIIMGDSIPLTIANLKVCPALPFAIATPHPSCSWLTQGSRIRSSGWKGTHPKRSWTKTLVFPLLPVRNT
jgi:hypothetical protein